MALSTYNNDVPEIQYTHRTAEAIAIGCSAGGLDALCVVLQALPPECASAVIIVAHTAPDGNHLLPALLARRCRFPVSVAYEREPVLSGHVYVAPPNYHLLIEADRSFALSVDERVCFVRPSIDVLFYSAADAYREKLAGIVLTGANSDGALGLEAVKKAGGYTLVQDPRGAYADTMPKAAIATGAADKVLPLDALATELGLLCSVPPKTR
ncbi:chemotaxis protein CheB [Candidatus Methylospira mobilis]|uniref:protein-glutamate methylesterase n=1 Tax=Candidatus Methylospira mobilis TaxID=1808979 RepID=A0A5Q0BJ74_9GAMM|nr:chemotaxis protein CheB [Candidatus Methylospira mobilis]QFY43860.1 chemotaxis protein CheB [Candidatus Methylospira mobilis]WNV04857.1 chemotaxis protein CheB [Candidatus Methylospira mobilis]